MHSPASSGRTSIDSPNRPTIYLDADACPVKDQVYRVAARHGVPLFIVANKPLRPPIHAGLTATVIRVGDDPDAADDWIVERAEPTDLVLTADIPLAARIVPNGIRCLDFRGGEFSPTRIGDALAARDLNAYLRSMGLPTSGPPPFTDRDRTKFASKLDSTVAKLVRAPTPDGRSGLTQ